MLLLNRFFSYLLVALLAGIPSGPAFSQLSILQSQLSIASSESAVETCDDANCATDSGESDDSSDSSAANVLDDVIHDVIVEVEPFFLASTTDSPREHQLQSVEPREDIRPPQSINFLS